MLDSCEADPKVSGSSHASCDDLSIEECERLVLSPSPVPMDLYVACDAINAAARRSNSSRTHSIQTQPTDGWCESGAHPSCSDLHKAELEKIPKSENGGRSFSYKGWSRLLCCFSARSSSRAEKTHMPTPSGDNDKGVLSGNHVDASRPVAVTPKEPKKFKFWPFRKTAKLNDLPSTQGENSDNRLGSPHTSLPCTDSEHCPASVPPCRPELPNSVLNALSSTLVSHPTSSHSVPVFATDARTSVNGASSHSTTTSSKKSFPSIIQRFPGFRSSASDGIKGAAKDLTISLDHSFANSQNEVNLDHCFTQTNHASNWVGGDIVDRLPTSDGDQPAYHIDVDQNGAQGDSSSEVLEAMTPGMDLLGETPPDCADKKCLVLDLDETLVHSWFKYVDNASFIVPVELDGIKHQIYVCKRPHLDEFLRAVAPLFECVMFTASLRKYADPVCDYIDEVSCFRHRLFREACVYHQNNLIKDLSRLGRNIDQICILDNSPVSFLFQPNNALQIVSWFDDPHDRALLELIPYFQGLAKSPTVVDYLREFRPPASAAIAQPPTPSWFFLFDTGVAPNELDDSDGPDQLEDVGYEYTEEEAVLSPHFHPPVPSHSSSSTSALVRSYLTQLDPQITGTHLVQHRNNPYPVNLVPSTNSFISQLVTTSDRPQRIGRVTTTTTSSTTVEVQHVQI